MNRLFIIAAASVVSAVGALVVLSSPAQAAGSTMLYGHIEGFEDRTELEAFVTFRDVKTGKYLHRDRTTIQIRNGKYTANVDTRQLPTNVPYEVEFEGLDAEESFTLVDFVELQASTPGSTQTGHLNISGYVLASRIGLGISPTIARVQVNETGSAQGVRSLTESGTAVYGQANATTGLAAGGYFTTKSVGGRAIVGDALSTTGSTVGGLFYNRAQAGVAVWGRHINGSGESIGVYGDTASADGTAVLATNNGTGDRAELAGANGSLYTEGTLPSHEYTPGTAYTMVPLAYGLIGVTGTNSFNRTGNYTVSHPSTGVYEITVDGASLNFDNSQMVATPYITTPCMISATDNGGSWTVRTYNSSGTAINAAFQFVIFGDEAYNPPAPPPEFHSRFNGDLGAWEKGDPRGFDAHRRRVEAYRRSALETKRSPIPKDELETPVVRPTSE